MRLKKEAIIAAIILAVTLVLIVPLAVIVGGTTLGEYAGSPGMTGYLGDVFGALAAGDAAIWFFVLSPLLALSLLRAGFGVAKRVQ